MKKPKCSESTVLDDVLPSPLVSACSESHPPTMLNLCPVTDLIHEEKNSADNDQQNVSPDDEKLTNEPTHITNNLTYDYLPQGNFFTYYL